MVVADLIYTTNFYSRIGGKVRTRKTRFKWLSLGVCLLFALDPLKSDGQVYYAPIQPNYAPIGQPYSSPVYPYQPLNGHLFPNVATPAILPPRVADSLHQNFPLSQDYTESTVTNGLRFPPVANKPAQLESPKAESPLRSLIEMENRVEAMLPSLLPAVVSIEGGSGVIVSSDGLILTASHVTKRASRIVQVRLSSGRYVSAETLGTNSVTDTAALKLLEYGPWPFISLGDSTSVDQGDWCIGLGYPLSFKRDQPAAVRIGRVLNRNKGRFVTDCPIMGGDSGGPLLNLDGHLIAISSRVKTDITQNLHVPTEQFQKDWNELAASKDVRKKKPEATANVASSGAYLGIFGETDAGRVRIKRVQSGSPAEIAGMANNDVILKLDHQNVFKFDDVLAVLQKKRPGDIVSAKLNRYGELIDVSVHLGGTR